MKIIRDKTTLWGTTFRQSDTAPRLQTTGNRFTLTVYDGEGKRRAWGYARYQTTVCLKTRTLVSVYVQGRHKFGWLQAWYHYIRDEEFGWRRKLWQQLSTRRQAQIIRAALPLGLMPGVLRTPKEHIGYKIVADEGGTLVSAYDRRTRYAVGQKTTCPIRGEDHGEGGLFYYDNPETALRAMSTWDFARDVKRFALLKVKPSGKRRAYGNKKAADHLRVISVEQRLSGRFAVS